MNILDPEKLKENWIPQDDERKLVTKLQGALARMVNLKNETAEILGNRKLQDFWDDSRKDYNVVTDEADENDPVVQYSTTIARDKSDFMIANLIGQLMYPSVIAQNRNQEIDRVMGKVCRGLVEYMHRNDGYPSVSGQEKLNRAIHKLVVEGTVHRQNDMSTKMGFCSSVIPNEEVFIPNYFQPDLQKQAIFARMQEKILYDETETEFGDLDNWEFVQPGRIINWNTENPIFRDITEGILEEEEVQIVRFWWPVPRTELKRGEQWAKYYNVMINGILMYPVKTRMPYRHGLYPISKSIFSYFADSDYYWGNSASNRMREDKRWADAWKTLIRYKGKLNVLPPLISVNGQHIHEEVVLPGKITPVTEETQLKKLEGVAEPINNSDIALLQMAEKEIDRSVSTPLTDIDPRQKARSAVIMESNTQKILDMFALQVSYLIQSQTYQMIQLGFQFFPRRTLKKIVVPEQTLTDGRRGEMEIIFEDLPDMTDEEKMQKSMEIRQEQQKALRMKKPKMITYVNPAYTKELTLYITADVGVNSLNKDMIERQQFNQRAVNVYLQRSDLFNSQAVARKMVQMNEDDEDILNTQPLQPMPAGNAIPMNSAEQRELTPVPAYG